MKTRRHHNNQGRRRTQRGKLKKDARYLERKYVMKERPIIFSGPMVRAILEGRKTQTRRVGRGPEPDEYTPKIAAPCPYGQPGDRLWVREGFAEGEWGGQKQIVYREALPLVLNGNGQPMRWRPSIHMPRTASRILLEITAVRIQNIQDISDQDAEAEGAIGYPSGSEDHHQDTVIYEFRKIWDSINAGRGYGWTENP